MFPTVMAVAAAELATQSAANHTWEIILAVATGGLAIVTTMLIVVSLRLARATEADAARLANNSVDSMENVAVHALDRQAKIAALNHLATRKPGRPLTTTIRTHRRR